MESTNHDFFDDEIDWLDEDAVPLGLSDYYEMWDWFKITNPIYKIHDPGDRPFISSDMLSHDTRYGKMNPKKSLCINVLMDILEEYYPQRGPEPFAVVNRCEYLLKMLFEVSVKPICLERLDNH